MLSLYGDFQQHKLDKVKQLLTKDQIGDYKKFQKCDLVGVDTFDPYTFLPDPEIRDNSTKKYLLFIDKPSSAMDRDEFQQMLMIAKDRPWDTYEIDSLKSGWQRFKALGSEIDCDPEEKMNELHFVPFSVDTNEDLKELFPKETPMILPMFMWIKGTEMLISAIDKGQLKLIGSGVITCPTNPTHAKFLEHWGFDNTGDNVMTISFDKLKANFKQMTQNDPSTKRIIDYGTSLYQDAMKVVPKYLDTFSESDFQPFFWKWYFSQKK